MSFDPQFCVILHASLRKWFLSVAVSILRDTSSLDLHIPAIERCIHPASYGRCSPQFYYGSLCRNPAMCWSTTYAVGETFLESLLGNFCGFGRRKPILDSKEDGYNTCPHCRSMPFWICACYLVLQTMRILPPLIAQAICFTAHRKVISPTSRLGTVISYLGDGQLQLVYECHWHAGTANYIIVD